MTHCTPLFLGMSVLDEIKAHEVELQLLKTQGLELQVLNSKKITIEGLKKRLDDIIQAHNTRIQEFTSKQIERQVQLGQLQKEINELQQKEMRKRLISLQENYVRDFGEKADFGTQYVNNDEECDSAKVQAALENAKVAFGRLKIEDEIEKETLETERKCLAVYESKRASLNDELDEVLGSIEDTEGQLRKAYSEAYQKMITKM